MFPVTIYQSFSPINTHFFFADSTVIEVSENLIACCTVYEQVGKSKYVISTVTLDMANSARKLHIMQIYDKSRIRTFWGWFTGKNKSTQSRVIFLVLTKTECVIAMNKDSVFYENNVYTFKHNRHRSLLLCVYTYENARNSWSLKFIGFHIYPGKFDESW